MEKVQCNQLTKKENGLEQSKNEKSSTLPRAPMTTNEYIKLKLLLPFSHN